jgi:hypothetical protein
LAEEGDEKEDREEEKLINLSSSPDRRLAINTTPLLTKTVASGVLV